METDEQKISSALSMWANHIETGDICLGAEDARKRNKKAKPISDEQMKFVLKLRELAKKALNGKIKIQD